MTAEGDKTHVSWQNPGTEGYRAKALCPISRFPHRGEVKEAKGPPRKADVFTFDGSDTILAHQLHHPAAAAVSIESCKLSIAAAAAADCGVAALAAAEGVQADAPLHLLAGLSNGQLWHLEVQQQPRHDEDQDQQSMLRLSSASKQLLLCRMAEPIDAACCYVCRDEPKERAAVGENDRSRWSLMVVVLYSDGVAVASWPEEDQTTELPAIEGGQRLSLSPLGSFVAISTNQRRLVVLERKGKQFSIVKDFSPLKLSGAGIPTAQPTWIGEEKLLLPGTTQLRCICSSTAWKEVEEPPSLPETGLPRELLLLQHANFGAGLHQQTSGKEQTIICGLATDGTLGLWDVCKAQPLLLVQCGDAKELRGLCCLTSAVANSTLMMLLRTDGSLGLLSLPLEVLETASQRLEPAGASPEDEKAGESEKSLRRKKDTPKKEAKQKKHTDGSATPSSPVEAFLHREAAEASSESDSDMPADELFNEAEGNTPQKQKPRKHRRRSRAGGSAESDSSSEESGEGLRGYEEENEEGPLPGAAEALASGVAALQSQLEEAQAMLNTLMRRQQEIFQPVIHPGGGPRPSDAGKPWCLFWTHFGHITKTVTADNSLLDVFNFFPGAAADGTAHRKLADLQNCSTASLCRAGVALAAEGSSHSALEFRSFLDAGSWVKHFPEEEKILAVAAGDSFVAAVTEDREGTLQLHCSLLHVHPNPSCAAATFRLPISCLKRRLAAPPAAAASAPDVDIIHEGFFDVDTPLDWIGISPGGMPAVKDTSGVVRGLLPVAATNAGGLGYAFKWVKMCSLAEASPSAPLFPIVIDEAKGELGVVRLKAADTGAAFPDCSVSEPFFGYSMEQIPLRIPSPDLWSFTRWHRLLRQDKQLKGMGDGGGDAALVPWPQYDELRLQQEMAIRQLNHFVHISAGSLGDTGCEAEAREAQRKLQLLMKRHDKFCLRGFAKCTDDKRLHGVAKEMALRLKTENAPQHARSLLDSDTRLQAEKLREALVWQEQQRVEFGEAAAAATSVSVDSHTFQNENTSPRQSAQQLEPEYSTAKLAAAAAPVEKKSSIQKLLQWQQQQQQQQRKTTDGSLMALFDDQKRRASESGTGRPAKKSFFYKAD